MSTDNASKTIYFRVWTALLALLLLTWGLAEYDLGAFNSVAALAISVGKMVLVVLFFMHVCHEKSLTWMFVAAGLIWFLIMVDLTLSDYLTRGVVTKSRQTWQHSESQAATLQPNARSSPTESNDDRPGKP